MTTRPIAAIALPGAVPGIVPTGKPELTWIDPRELLVDASYQRGIGERGTRLIRRIVETFDWRKFKPPTAVWTDEGLEVLDGQHSAIAAATHPAIEQIPVVIVEAEHIADRAGAFLGLNRDRLGVTALQMHTAAVVAGNAEAAAIDRVCQACSVNVLRMPPSAGAYKPRDTVAVRGIADLIRREGEDVATGVVRLLAEADLAPITAAALRAAESIMVDAEYADMVEPAELTRAIVALGAEADKEASVFAATHCVPKWRGLVAVWFKKAKKRRPLARESLGEVTGQKAMQVVDDADAKGHESSMRSPPGSTGLESKIEPQNIPGNIPSRRPKRYLGGNARVSGTSATMVGGHVGLGDPPPGRSALDQGSRPGGSLR